jgi:hypothetical protein
MAAPVSPVVSRPAAALTPAPTGYPWVKGLPDLNRQTTRLIGESGAGWTFTTICSLLHHIGRVGRPRARHEAKERQRLSVGLAAVADTAGLSIGKVRRDCTKLAKLGLIVTIRPNVTMERDLETGRLKENRTGRSKATVIVLTVCQEHLRQKASPPIGQAVSPPRMAPSSPTRLGGLPAHDSVHPGGAIQRDRNTKRTPDGLAVGIGQPQAEGEAGLPAGPAGGQEAAEEGRLPAASHEEGNVPLRIVVADDADEQAHLPPGRLTPQAAKPREPQRRTWSGQGGQERPSAPPQAYRAVGEQEWERKQREAEHEILAEKYAKALGMETGDVIGLWKRDKTALKAMLDAAGIEYSTGRRRADRPRPTMPTIAPPEPNVTKHRRTNSTFDTDRAKAETLAALGSLRG